MGKNDILVLLRMYKGRCAGKYGINALGVFGSVARDQATGDSDVDIVVKMEQPNLVTLSRIRLEIEEMVHTHVDIVHYRDTMNKLLKKRIDEEAVYA
ncbi:MAG: nucleotidyltransferase [Candidatus Raymondbacteria bacterium RifOxyC12_full_50_8]|uniref:Nucleotidyltransferase n=1 Tax=Candidatus Raymondbacteria bacterium RIFOXYD12_FULL_49_13 TaxID=1817890 RepID=A0A1F7F373_UNCRA|nr:MAG: nucleotidyltransferase [Candidatus Raymondbacteria bacterium RIFOXYA2_FULL_49_16]OGJ96786.1 MAG: nucleotidyltransferase [Candidatus Raymondbacteria bacterium RifOxyC12_full_50_8]OGK01124.1 MAG: nucleotidyltransferase [Candidatus Raymondbacteria bacterium RIFOXYD12_FULL_49_13]OGP39345.1 MAG: nucleotidyltransferase [Candidatus Raymondbacteria bacterium RIFOXYB2_FULL_49_35]